MTQQETSIKTFESTNRNLCIDRILSGLDCDSGLTRYSPAATLAASPNKMTPYRGRVLSQRGSFCLAIPRKHGGTKLPHIPCGRAPTPVIHVWTPVRVVRTRSDVSRPSSDLHKHVTVTSTCSSDLRGQRVETGYKTPRVAYLPLSTGNVRTLST